jgi:hypothetical protein
MQNTPNAYGLRPAAPVGGIPSLRPTPRANSPHACAAIFMKNIVLKKKKPCSLAGQHRCPQVLINGSSNSVFFNRSGYHMGLAFYFIRGVTHGHTQPRRR